MASVRSVPVECEGVAFESLVDRRARTNRRH